MLGEQRRLLVAERLRRQGTVTIAELEKSFGISAMTARRDLAALAKLGQARRTHGGAVSLNYARYESEFAARVDTSREAKERIARAAATIVRREEAVFFDASSTAYYIAEELLRRNGEITILTNSLPILALVFEMGGGNATVIACGGELRRRSLSFVGPHAIRTIRSHFVDIAFLSAKGLSDDGWLTDPDPLEAEVKRTMVERSARRMLAIDASKFGERGMNAICELAVMSGVVTDDADAFHERFPFDGEVVSA